MRARCSAEFALQVVVTPLRLLQAQASCVRMPTAVPLPKRLALAEESSSIAHKANTHVVKLSDVAGDGVLVQVDVDGENGTGGFFSAEVRYNMLVAGGPCQLQVVDDRSGRIVPTTSLTTPSPNAERDFYYTTTIETLRDLPRGSYSVRIVAPHVEERDDDRCLTLRLALRLGHVPHTVHVSPDSSGALDPSRDLHVSLRLAENMRPVESLAEGALSLVDLVTGESFPPASIGLSDGAILVSFSRENLRPSMRAKLHLDTPSLFGARSEAYPFSHVYAWADDGPWREGAAQGARTPMLAEGDYRPVSSSEARRQRKRESRKQREEEAREAAERAAEVAAADSYMPPNEPAVLPEPLDDPSQSRRSSERRKRRAYSYPEEAAAPSPPEQQQQPASEVEVTDTWDTATSERSRARRAKRAAAYGRGSEGEGKAADPSSDSESLMGDIDEVVAAQPAGGSKQRSSTAVVVDEEARRPNPVVVDEDPSPPARGGAKGRGGDDPDIIPRESQPTGGVKGGPLPEEESTVTDPAELTEATAVDPMDSELGGGGASKPKRPPTREELREHERRAQEHIEWATRAGEEACQFQLDGRCVTPLQCEQDLCSGHGYCVKYSSGPACNCDPGFASSGGQFCNVCESDVVSFPRCTVESIGDKLAESVAMERVCAVFELPFSLDQPGMLGSRHSFYLRDWFLLQQRSVVNFNLSTASTVRLHVIPADPHDVLSARLVDLTPAKDRGTGGGVDVARAAAVKGAPPLLHEGMLMAVVPEGQYRLEIEMSGDAGDIRAKDCKRMHVNIGVTPSVRLWEPLRPYQCPEQTTVPQVDTAGLRKNDFGAVVIPQDGLEFNSQAGSLAVSGRTSSVKRAREIWSFDFTTEKLVDMVPLIDADLSSEFISSHLRLALQLLSEDGRALERSPHGFDLTASAQVFVSNTDPDDNHIATDLKPGAPYRLSIYEVAPRIDDAPCGFYDVTFGINYVDTRGSDSASSLSGYHAHYYAEAEQQEDGWVGDKCALAALPRTLNIPGFLGYDGKMMHTHEVYRYNPNEQEHRISFIVKEASLLRVYVPFHQTQLTVTTSVLKDTLTGVGQGSPQPIASGSNEINDDVTAELTPGNYVLVFSFSHADTLVRTPGSMRCVGFEAEIALAPAASLGAKAHWCGPSNNERESLPDLRSLIARDAVEAHDHAMTTFRKAYVIVNNGGLLEKSFPFEVDQESMSLELVVDSDFITGHVAALVRERKTAEPTRTGLASTRKDGDTKLVVPAHQLAPNHQRLTHTLKKGSYELVLRPLYVHPKRTCVPFDLEFHLHGKEHQHKDDHCAKAGFEHLPPSLNSARFLSGSGQTHTTHFAANFYTHASTASRASFSVDRQTATRVAIQLRPSDVHATKDLRFALLRFECMESGRAPPYPYVHVEYDYGMKNGEHPCEGEVVWEETQDEFSRFAKLDPGYYEIVASYSANSELKEGTWSPEDPDKNEHHGCLRFHMEFAAAPIDEGGLGLLPKGSERCMNGADHLPPHPPEILSSHYHYDSQTRSERLAYQISQGRHVSFMAPFVAEMPFRLIVEIGYDFLVGDLRIDLARHPKNRKPGDPANMVEHVFKGRALSGRRRRFAASVLPPGEYSLWMHEPMGSQKVRHASEEGMMCLGFTWRVEFHVLEPQRAHRLTPELLHPEIQERLANHPALPLTLNTAGCLVPRGECELFGVYSVMHQVWNANLPSQNWEENSVAFTITRPSLMRVHASPHVLGAIRSRAVLRIRLVSLGKGPGSGNEFDMQAPKVHASQEDDTSDDWLVKQLNPGAYAIVINIRYPGTAKAFHTWRMHFAVALHVAIAPFPPLPGGLFGLPSSGRRSVTQTEGACGGPTCGGVSYARTIREPGDTWKLDEPNASACAHEPQRGQPDPQCAHGIKSDDGMVCCPKSCGSCGGENCHMLPLGEKACCGSSIKEHQGSCARRPAPCNLFGDGSRVVRTVVVTVAEPQGASLIAETSFGFLHQHLALLLEGRSRGTSPTGRVIERDVKYKGIPQHLTSYLDVDVPPGVYNVTLVELAPAPAAHQGPCDARKYSFLVYAKAKAKKVAATQPPIAATDNWGPTPTPEPTPRQQEWEKTLDLAAKDSCALIIDVPHTLLPLPKDLHAYSSSQRSAPRAFSRSPMDEIQKADDKAASNSAEKDRAPDTPEDAAEAAAAASTQPALVQTWGGATWSRIHAEGFNLLKTEAATVNLEKLGISGEGGAYAVKVEVPDRTVVRLTAGTNMDDEQLLFAMVNATGSFVKPTLHYPTEYENPAMFILDPNSRGGGGGEGAAGQPASPSEDPMDALLMPGGVFSHTTHKDYYVLLQPRREPRTEDNEKEEECPSFSVDLAAAPAASLLEWLSTGAGGQRCEEILPQGTVEVGADGHATQTLKGSFTSESKTHSVHFRVTVKSNVNVTLLHNFLAADFLVTIRRTRDGKSEKEEAMEVVATSEDNVFVLGTKDANKQAAAGDLASPMMSIHDVGAVIETRLDPGMYVVQIQEHMLREYPKLAREQEASVPLLCADFLWDLSVRPLSDHHESLKDEATREAASSSETGRSTDDEVVERNDGGRGPAAGREQQEEIVATPVSEPETDLGTLMEEQPYRRPGELDRAFRRRYQEWRNKMQRMTSKSSSSPPSSPSSPSSVADASSAQASERCAADSCGCASGGGSSCVAIGRCTEHEYGNAVSGTYTKVLCSCPDNFEGARCERCKSGFVDWPQCNPDPDASSGRILGTKGNHQRGVGGGGRGRVVDEDGIVDDPTLKDVEEQRHARTPVLIAYVLTVVLTNSKGH
uniref:EGF-like domain-containing protein n=2 Tax=Lotharella globosa TaxID=91324 RepID=A0A6V3QDF9_9EUKA